MFARKLRLELVDGQGARPAPEKWLSEFFMRNFIGLSAFDETLVTGDGEMETGLAVDPKVVQDQLEKWLRGRKLIPAQTRLQVRSR